MNGRELFDAWAPAGLPWSDWAKPALFAQLREVPPTTMPPVWEAITVTGLPDQSQSHETALIVDLPGPQSIAMGIALTRLGYRPVPLFNCTSARLGEVVDTTGIRVGFDQGAPILRDSTLDSNAPPAFLLDSRRLLGGNTVRPGMFDNRWVVLPQDFPSANLLLSRGIQDVILVQADGDRPRDDLAHILRRWQESGLRVQAYGPGQAGDQPHPIVVEKPRFFRSLLHRMQVLTGLRRNSAGGFGSAIPIVTSSSGHYG